MRREKRYVSIFHEYSEQKKKKEKDMLLSRAQLYASLS